MTFEFRTKTLTLSFAIVLASAVCALAQISPSVEASNAADRLQKRSTLVEIIRHESRAIPTAVAATIGAGLNDLDPSIREVALAAVVSRAAGPRIAPRAEAVSDWPLDAKAIQGLRPQVVGLLADASESVRSQAVAALASLDFKLGQEELALSPATQRLLVARYYADPSPRVRAKIVAGFSADREADSPAMRKLLADAFGDSDHRVRHAATNGALKLGTDGISAVVKQLQDTDRSVRRQAALALVKIGVTASTHRRTVEEALLLERDPEVRQSLQRAVTAMRQ